MLRQVDLAPTLTFPQGSNAFAEENANILCHSPIIGLVYPLYLAHTLFRGESRRRAGFSVNDTRSDARSMPTAPVSPEFQNPRGLC